MTLFNPWPWLRAKWSDLVGPWRRGRSDRRKPVRYAEVDDLPATLDDDVLYVVGEGRYRWYAAMICPCGCGVTLHLGLLEDARPRWRVVRQRGGTASLHPSVHRRVGCRSHFWLERGRVRWC